MNDKVDQLHADIEAGVAATIVGPSASVIPTANCQPPASSGKTNFFKTELELGHCLRLSAEGPCECDLYPTCAKFVTTAAYVPRLRQRHVTELALAAEAANHGWDARWNGTTPLPGESPASSRTSPTPY